MADGATKQTGESAGSPRPKSSVATSGPVGRIRRVRYHAQWWYQWVGRIMGWSKHGVRLYSYCFLILGDTILRIYRRAAKTNWRPAFGSRIEHPYFRLLFVRFPVQISVALPTFRLSIFVVLVIPQSNSGIIP
jgi:hypothetical protein